MPDSAGDKRSVTSALAIVAAEADQEPWKVDEPRRFVRRFCIEQQWNEMMGRSSNLNRLFSVP